jgi:glycosidase
LPPAFAFHLTFPTVPAIYYGDEIGMRYVPGLPDTEGSVMVSGYNRTGSRTPPSPRRAPMQNPVHDYPTQKRTPKASSGWYRDFIAAPAGRRRPLLL